MAVTAADCPAKFDLVLNDGSGHVNGYVFAKDDQSGLYYRPRRASYGISPTFVERTNVQGNYGDNQQDFWMTFSQNDWSLGEGQRFFKQDDADKVRRYSAGSDIDVISTPGQVSIAKQFVSANVGTSSTAASVVLCASNQGGGVVYVADDGHVYRDAASRTDLGLFPSSGTASCIAVDSTHPSDTASQVYVSNGSKVDRYDGSWHTAWSSSGAQQMVFLNNSLYGLGSTSSKTDLVRFATDGTRSILFTWKGATGGDPAGLVTTKTNRLLYPFGGKLLILIPNSGNGASLWIYDGTAPSKLMDFPIGFTPMDLCVVNGIAYVSGKKGTGTSPNKDQGIIFYYANGTSGILWQGSDQSASFGCYLSPYNGNLAFTYGGSRLYLYNTATGGVSKISTTAAHSRIEQGVLTVAGVNYSGLFAWDPSTSTITSIYGLSGQNTTGTLFTSLFDGGSALDKYFKAVKVDWDAASDGDGGSVDISYALNTDGGSYTSVQTGAVAGTEYTIGQAGRSISIGITLNKGTSTNGPILKRIYVRAAPKLQAFKRREYVLELAGQNGKDMVQLRDGTTHNKDGMDMATDLQTYYIGALPVTVTDRFGTFTGYIEPDQSQIIEAKPEVFFAHLTVRQV